MADTATFFQFSCLPIELRLKIWRFTFPPRDINIWVVKHHLTACYLPCIHFTSHPECTHDKVEQVLNQLSTRMSVLEICHESRLWALENDILPLEIDLLLQENASGWITCDTRAEAVIIKKDQKLEHQIIAPAMRRHSPRTAIDLKNDTILLGIHRNRRLIAQDWEGRRLFEFSTPLLSVLLMRLGHTIAGRIRFLEVDIHVLMRSQSCKLEVLLVLKSLQHLTVVDTTIGPTALQPRRRSAQSFVEEGLEKLVVKNPDWRRPRCKFVKVKRISCVRLGNDPCCGEQVLTESERCAMHVDYTRPSSFGRTL